MDYRDLELLVHALARARQAEARLAERLARAKERMQESEAGRAYEAARQEYGSATLLREHYDSELRAALLAAQGDAPEGRKWAWGQNKRRKVLTYDQDKALAYCREHLPKALRLDAKVFEKAAAVLDLDFVTVEESWMPTVATDLSAWAELEDEP